MLVGRFVGNFVGRFNLFLSIIVTVVVILGARSGGQLVITATSLTDVYGLATIMSLRLW